MAADRVDQEASVALLSAAAGHKAKRIWSPDPDTTEVRGQWLFLGLGILGASLPGTVGAGKMTSNVALLRCGSLLMAAT